MSGLDRNPSTLVPDPNTRIIFAAATAFVRKFAVGRKPVQLTSAHKGSRITLDEGWIIIDERWYSKS